MTEREIHQEFNKWLRERQIPFVESRMDRRSTIAKAWPDYTVCWMSRVVLIEVKSSVGRLRPDQVKMIEYIKRSGNKVEIARSVRECVEAVNSILCEGKRCTEPPGGCNYPLEECFKELKRAVVAVPDPIKAQSPGNGKKRDGNHYSILWDKGRPTTIVETKDLSGGVESRHAGQKSERQGNAISPDRMKTYVGPNGIGVEIIGPKQSGSSAPPAQNISAGNKTCTVQDQKEQEEPCSPAENFFIIYWQGNPYVVARRQDGEYGRIRPASQMDVLNLPRLP